MLKNLFGESKSGARAPSGLRLYAVGDIHGRADLLDRLLADIDRDAAGGDGRAQLIFLGDYIDRGPDSAGVIDRLVALGRERPETVFLKGNHEAVMLDFLADPWGASDWLSWGGVETLKSYGLSGSLLDDPDALADALRAQLPASHLVFLQSLELWRRFGDYFFVHAGVRPGAPLSAQTEQDLLWIRGEFHNAEPDERPDKVIVHGHHPMKKPLDAGWRIAVDTGACFTGRLTAVALEGETRRFIST